METLSMFAFGLGYGFIGFAASFVAIRFLRSAGISQPH